MKLISVLLLFLTQSAVATLITIVFMDKNGDEISTKKFRIADGYDPTTQGLIVVILVEDDGVALEGGELTIGAEFVMKWPNRGDQNMLRNERNAYYLLDAHLPQAPQWFPRVVGYGRKLTDPGFVPAKTVEDPDWLPGETVSFHGQEHEVLLLEILKCTFQEVDFVENCSYREIISLGYDIVLIFEILHGKKMSHNDLKYENLMFRAKNGLRPVLIDHGFDHFPNDLLNGSNGGSLLYRCWNLDRDTPPDPTLESVNDFESLGILLAYAGSKTKPKTLPWLSWEREHENPPRSLTGRQKWVLRESIRNAKAKFPEPGLELITPKLFKIVQKLVDIGRGKVALDFVTLKKMFTDTLQQLVLLDPSPKAPSALENAVAQFRRVPPSAPPSGSSPPKRAPPPVPTRDGRGKLDGPPAPPAQGSSTTRATTSVNPATKPLNQRTGISPAVKKPLLGSGSKYREVSYGVYEKIV